MRAILGLALASRPHAGRPPAEACALVSSLALRRIARRLPESIAIPEDPTPPAPRPVNGAEGA
jgi:hypothetical protein